MILEPGIIRCSLQVYWSLTTAFYYLMRVYSISSPNEILAQATCLQVSLCDKMFT